MKYKEKIKQRGLLISWVAKKIGVSHVLLSYYLNDKRPIPYDVESKLKKFLR